MATQLERKEGTRGRILEAAGALFSEQGFDQTSVDQIVARANVAKGTFYQHFQTKIEVGVAIGRAELGDFYTATLESLERGGDPVALLHRFLARICEHFERNPVVAEAVLRHQVARAVAGNPDNTGTTRLVVNRIFQAAKKQGLLRRGVSADDVADLVAGAFMQAVFTWSTQLRHEPGGAALHPRVRRFTNLILNGSLAR